jgi:hypothetical protein
MRRTLLALTLLAVAVSPLRAEAPKAEPVTVPFEMLQMGRLFSGHIAVQAKVNGHGPYRLIFDTGAPLILLSNKVAKEAGLRNTGDKRPAAGLFLLPGQVSVRQLEVGDLSAHDLPAVVIDHPTVKAIADVFGPIDGIVGFPFFARFRTAIDYQARKLSFTPNGYKPADVMQALMTLLLAQPRDRNGPPVPRVLAPAAQWGLRVEKAADDPEPGVTIAEVFAGGAAAKASLKVGDRLLTLDGRWTDSVADCYQAAAAVPPREVVELLLSRAGRMVRLTVKPAAGL